MFGAWQQNEQPNEKLSGPVLAPLPVLGEDVLLFRWKGTTELSEFLSMHRT